MSDQKMNASDQGSQPDSGSSPNDQVNVDAQGSFGGRAGKGTRPEPSDAGTVAIHTGPEPHGDVTDEWTVVTHTGPEPHGDVTEEAHKRGQH